MSVDDRESFKASRARGLKGLREDTGLREKGIKFVEESGRYGYSYNFDWLGLPIIQYPQDMVALQEIIWRIKPSWIIETGIARGGSQIFYASMQHLINQGGRVLGVDLEIREHNRTAIREHPMSGLIEMIEGSSIDMTTIDKVKSTIENSDKNIVVLDSNHSRDHVLEELRLYSQFVSAGSYLIVLDTAVAYMPDGYFKRGWDKVNNPKTAVEDFLKETDRFEIDFDIEDKLVITTAYSGYLKCVK